MNWKEAILLVIVLCGMVWLLFSVFSPGMVEVSDFNPTSSARLTLNNLSYEEKIGQRFIVGFQGTSVSPRLKGKIKELNPGGVLLLGRNIQDKKQLKELVNDLQGIALKDTGLPLLVAVDQEGEPLCRIDWLNCVAPSAIEKKGRAYEVGLKRGKELKELGVNLNLAPVLDKSYPGDFVYPRTFQADNAGEETKVLRSNGEKTKALRSSGELAKSFIFGQRKNVFNALKHFPGYTTIDFDPERKKLAELDFVPDIEQFEIAMEANPAMVMTSNVIYDEISQYPLTMSADGIDFVQEKLHPGLIISDNLSSPVLKSNYGLKSVVRKSVKAGVDILLVAGFGEPIDPERAIKHLREEEVNNEQLNKSVLKIIKLKQKVNEESY